ncbi:hypothetical protein Tco_1079240 [Tanacetum coccineum]|uniref:Uncharacterized protein n=1 Tax=Tanacetum coccineum TaxID=301880 RepID=A0ABQ5HRR0_9ASTR
MQRGGVARVSDLSVNLLGGWREDLRGTTSGVRHGRGSEGQVDLQAVGDAAYGLEIECVEGVFNGGFGDGPWCPCEPRGGVDISVGLGMHLSARVRQGLTGGVYDSCLSICSAKAVCAYWWLPFLFLCLAGVEFIQILRSENVGIARGGRVPYDQRNNPPQHLRIVYPSILNINYFSHFLDIIRNYDPMDDEPMWAADHVVAPTPASAISIPETANEFSIKGNHLTLVKGNQFDG